ncbi:unnamed protein product [Closterium sp. NIES-54]
MIAQSQLAAISGGSTAASATIPRRWSRRDLPGLIRQQQILRLSPRVPVQLDAHFAKPTRAVSVQARASLPTADEPSAFDPSSRLIPQQGNLDGSDFTAPEQLVADGLLSRRSLVALSSAALTTSLLAPPSTSASPDSTSLSLGPAVIPPCPPGSTVEIQIGDNCGLGVAIYPDFSYSPGGVAGGGGSGTATDLTDGSDRVEIVFDPQTLNIPPLRYDTTRFLGLPLPPPLKIDIAPAALRGYLERSTGKVELTFISKFFFTAGPIYTAPPLTVETILTTESSAGPIRSAKGSRLDASGKCTLVGVARVPPVNDSFLDTFLLLPTDVLAVLPAELRFKPVASA